MRFLSYFHDPDNLFLPLLDELELPDELQGSIVAVTPETTVQIYEKLKTGEQTAPKQEAAPKQTLKKEEESGDQRSAISE